MAEDERVVDLLQQIRDLLARHLHDNDPHDDADRPEVRGD